MRVAETPAASAAGAFIAQELSSFKDARLDVALTVYGHGPEALEAVITNNADIGTTTPIGLALAIARNIPLRLIGNGPVYVSNAPTVGLFVPKDSPIVDARGLAGKTIAVQTLVDNQILAVNAWLVRAGLDPQSIKAIELPFSEVAAALQRGTVAAGMLAEPFMAAAKDTARILPGVYETLGPRWGIQVWFASNSFARQNPALVSRYMSGVYAAAKVVNRNPGRLRPILTQYTKMAPEVMKSIYLPMYAESTDARAHQPQLDLAYKYKQLVRPLSVAEMMG